MKILIGIISYLKDEIREERLSLLTSLIESCNSIFNLPIYIVIQNYKSNDIIKLNRYSNVTLSDNYSKLGILQARKTLREYFIHSDYDYLIMLDDDCSLSGYSSKSYIKQIVDNPDCFIEFNQTLLKLFAISKSLFTLVNFEDVNPELEEGFEDRVFVNKLRKLYPNRRRVFENTNIKETSISTRDKYSTWYTNQNIKEMLKKTEKINSEIK